MFEEENKTTVDYVDFEKDHTDFVSKTNNQIIEELNAPFSNPLNLLFIPKRYWTVEDHSNLKSQTFDGIIKDIIACHIKDSDVFLKNSAKYKNKNQQLYRKAVDLLMAARIGQTKTFLDSVFAKIKFLDIQNFEYQTVLISKVVKLSPNHRYQLQLLDLIGRKGWLQTQSILHIAILATKLNNLIERHQIRPINAKEIISLIDSCLSPLYLATGKELQSYWVPNFLFIMEYPDMLDDTEIKPAHFDNKISALTEEVCLSFINELDKQTSINWCKTFAYSLGLLD